MKKKIVESFTPSDKSRTQNCISTSTTDKRVQLRNCCSSGAQCKQIVRVWIPVPARGKHDPLFVDLNAHSCNRGRGDCLTLRVMGMHYIVCFVSDICFFTSCCAYIVMHCSVGKVMCCFETSFYKMSENREISSLKKATQADEVWRGS